MAKSVIERKLDALTTVVEKSFAAVADDISVIKERMATNAELAEFRVETEANFRSIRIELVAISKRLEILEQQFSNLRGVTKEIDDIRDRVRDIEKHLGLAKKIAA